MNTNARWDEVDTHPLLDIKRAYFDTACFRYLMELITEWLWTGATGAFVVGAHRIGKSWAVRALVNQLALRNGKKVPVLYMSMADRDLSTIAEVSRQACFGQDLPISTKAPAHQMTNQLLHHIEDLQVAAKVRTAVLIVDEFDLLSPRQFNAFVELFNRLDVHNRYLLIIFVGNREESKLLLERMSSDRYKKISGRFFKRFVEVFGIRSQKELHALMAQYDTLRYPSDGPTYTQYFLPNAVASGWRFATLSKDLWRQYSVVAKDYKLDSWGMEYVVGTLNILMTDLLPHYGWEEIDDDILIEAIKMTYVTDEFPGNFGE